MKLFTSIVGMFLNLFKSKPEPTLPVPRTLVIMSFDFNVKMGKFVAQVRLVVNELAYAYTISSPSHSGVIDEIIIYADMKECAEIIIRPHANPIQAMAMRVTLMEGLTKRVALRATTMANASVKKISYERI